MPKVNNRMWLKRLTYDQRSHLRTQEPLMWRYFFFLLPLPLFVLVIFFFHSTFCLFPPGPHSLSSSSFIFSFIDPKMKLKQLKTCSASWTICSVSCVSTSLLHVQPRQVQSVSFSGSSFTLCSMLIFLSDPPPTYLGVCVGVHVHVCVCVVPTGRQRHNVKSLSERKCFLSLPGIGALPGMRAQSGPASQDDPLWHFIGTTSIEEWHPRAFK